MKCNSRLVLVWTTSDAIRGRIQGDAQRARAPPLISIVVIFQTIILYTINPPVSDMLVPAPSTPKYIPFPFKELVSGIHHWRHYQIKDSD